MKKKFYLVYRKKARRSKRMSVWSSFDRLQTFLSFCEEKKIGRGNRKRGKGIALELEERSGRGSRF